MVSLQRGEYEAMFNLIWVVLSCMDPVPVPEVTPTPTLSYTAGGACCPIGEGPWNIEKGAADTSGGFTSQVPIGRIWSFDSPDDLDGSTSTRDWYEYAERVSTAGTWAWMSSGVAWRATMKASMDQPDINCNVAGYLKCQEYEVYTANVSNPSDEQTARPAAGDRVKLPAEYHAPGQYKVWATYDAASPTTVVGWYFTKVVSGVRQEVWCLPSVWSWPRRQAAGQESVTWVMRWHAGPPTALPTNIATCNAIPDVSGTASLQSNSIKL